MQNSEKERISIAPHSNEDSSSRMNYSRTNSGSLVTIPPLFNQSHFDIVLRRQRSRKEGMPKFTAVPSRFLNLTNDFEFAGWGSISHLILTPEDIDQGEVELNFFREQQVLGQFTASALAANDILGGVFYTLPSVVAVAGVYSPISLFVAALTLFLWRPVMEEMASALPISGAPYTYLLNVSTKSVALLGAALLLLDFSATAVVSAATAASYLAGEVSLPFPVYIGAALVFVLFTFVSLSGLRESARVATGILVMHGVVMIILIVASVIAWGRGGMAQLSSNWLLGHAGLSPAAIARQVFNGICLGMLGLTGFECAPAYTSKMKKNCYPKVLRNLHLPALFLTSVMMLLVVALLPLDVVENGNNILSLLAQKVAGRWLRIMVVVDAVVVLCAGVLTGILSACELLIKLSCDRVLPRVFLATVPATGAPYVTVVSFIAFSALIYASTGANLIVVSQMFTMVWLAVMALFPISLILLRFSRPRLPRASQCSLIVVAGAISVTVTIAAGNVAIDPIIAGWFALYLLILLVLFYMSQNKVTILRWIYWAYDQLPWLHRLQLTKGWGDGLIRRMRSLRRREVCLLVKTDEINNLFNMILYVRYNEETSCLKIVHFHSGDVPSEMEANAKILDEAFPEITVDLMFIKGQFDPKNLAALAHHLKIPRSLMFMSSPGPNFLYPVAELGTRIISI
ncbi:amino acid permease-domain-containing protein [Suillus subalutaceus]|uniref:amino acid permease-domain-containing protein n=1 Tax=Suillus subalutaceus TaxID=48586 RepID=UPI001B87CEBE|nr:amino acid permease-domain-containing protein [Suillus subalutaceus]KAG1872974.1 amino acid permease-domain-containing protein [Suillus subalutaceus]